MGARSGRPGCQETGYPGGQIQYPFPGPASTWTGAGDGIAARRYREVVSKVVEGGDAGSGRCDRKTRATLSVERVAKAKRVQLVRSEPLLDLLGEVPAGERVQVSRDLIQT